MGQALPPAGPALRHGAEEGRAPLFPLLNADELAVQELVLQTLENESDQE